MFCLIPASYHARLLAASTALSISLQRASTSYPKHAQHIKIPQNEDRLSITKIHKKKSDRAIGRVRCTAPSRFGLQ